MTSAGSNTYTYDANGNMLTRRVSNKTITFTYDAEGHLMTATGTGLNASFVYNADGQRVKQTIAGVTTSFIGNYYEVTGSTVTKYYFAGGQRIAMRQGTTLYYLLTDHLGSTSITTSSAGTKVAEMRYKACPLRFAPGVLHEGEVRYTSGTTPTKNQIQGQFSNMAEFGLVYMNARWYDSSLGRWAEADSIVSGGTQGLDRYAFVNNNPVRFTDPSGHYCWAGDDPLGNASQCGKKNIMLPPPVTLPPAGTPDLALTPDGQVMYDLFVEWRDTPGWWNDDGNSPFGLEEFLGLWILFESYSNPDYAAMANGEATAVAQALYAGGYNPSTCRVGGVCSNAVFNYIGANIDTKNPSALISGPNSRSNGLFVAFNPKLGDAANIRRRISELGTKALNPNSVIIWDRWAGPSAWGNYKYWGPALANAKRPPGTALDTAFFYSDSAIIYSVDQQNYWEFVLNVDMTWE